MVLPSVFEKNQVDHFRSKNLKIVFSFVNSSRPVFPCGLKRLFHLDYSCSIKQPTRRNSRNFLPLIFFDDATSIVKDVLIFLARSNIFVTGGHSLIPGLVDEFCF